MPIDVSLNDVADLTNTVTAQNTINTNSNTITTAFSSALNTAGDAMDGTLDMNSNAIINLPAPVSGQSPVRLVDISTSTTISLALPSMTGVVTAAATAGKSVTTFSGSGNLPVAQLAGGSGATNITFFRGDGTWASPASITLTAGTGITVSTATVPVIAVTNAIPITATSDTNVTLTLSTANTITAGWTGALSVARGGFGTAGTASIGGMVYSLNATAFAISTSATTNNQMWLSKITATPVLSTSVWPVDVTTTNQILVCSASHTWSASQTVTNLTLTTPTLTTATMTGTTVMANATMSGNLTFSTATLGVVGQADASINGATGCIGEVVSTSISQGSAVALVSGAASSIVSAVIPAGDWDGKALIHFQNNSAGSQISQISGSISTTASAVSVAAQGYANWIFPATSTFASTGIFTIVPYQRFNATSSATMFINVASNFTGSVSAFCQMQWRRAR